MKKYLQYKSIFSIHFNKTSACKKYAWIKWICYVIFLFWSFWNDFHFFDFTYEDRTSYYVSNGNPNSLIFYILVKTIFIVLSYLFFTHWFNVVHECIKGNELVIQKTKIVLKIFIVYMILLALMYPGMWVRSGLDEFQIVRFAQRLQIQYHQGVVSSVMYILSLMCLSKPVMVVIVQMVIGAMILGNAAFDIKRKSNKAYICFMFMVFSPAALYFSLYPLRIYLFSVVLVAFLHYWLKISKNDARKTDLIIMTLLVCILINVRIEIMFLIILYPILLLKHYGKKAVMCAEFVVLGSLLAGSIFNSLGNQACKKSHNSLMLCGPLCLFLQDDSIDKTKWQDDIANINVVWDVEELRAKGGYKYVQGERDDTYSSDEYKKYLVSATKIFINYPDLYIKSKVLCALEGLGLSDTYNSIRYAFPVEIKPLEIQELFSDTNIETHDRFAGILAGDFYIGKVNMYYVFYAFWLPSLLIIVTLFANIKRNKTLSIACLILTIQFLLTIATEPTSYQIYFFVEYMAGWYLILYSLAYKNNSERI